MSGFQNPPNLTTNSFQGIPYPGSVNHQTVSPTWVDSGSQSLVLPSSYASTSYQQLGGQQIIYPVNLVQSPPGLTSTINQHHLPSTITDGISSQTSLMGPGRVVFQSTPNLISPVYLTGPLVTNTQFIPNTFHSQPKQIWTQAVGVTNPNGAVTYGFSQQQPQLGASLVQLNDAYQQKPMIILQQQQQQKEINLPSTVTLNDDHQQQQFLLHQQQQQQEQQQQQQQFLQKQELKITKTSVDEDHLQEQILLLQQQLQQQQEQQRKQQQQMLKLEEKEHLLEQNLQQQQKEQQHKQEEQHRQLLLQEQQRQQLIQERNRTEHKTNVPTFIVKSSHKPINLTIIKPNNETNQMITQIQSDSVAHSITAQNTLTSPTTSSPSPSLSPASQPSPQIYDTNANQPRLNTVPIILPKSLNASLQLKSKSNAIETNSSQKTTQSSRHHFQKDTDLSKLNGAKSEVNEKISSENSSVIVSPESSPGAPKPQVKTTMPDNYFHKPVYEKPKNKYDCLRCSKKVYHMEQTGPIKGAMYHKNCFTCVVCGTTLNIKNFHHNSNDPEDLSVFCVTHKPKGRANSCDANAMLIKSALAAPKLDRVNEQIRSDRHHSEVLARTGYIQAETSSMTTAPEHFYYGMEQHALDDVMDKTHQLQRHEQNSKSYPEQSLKTENPDDIIESTQHEQERNHISQQEKNHISQQENHYDNFQLLNYQHQHTALDNEKRFITDLANIRLSQNADTNIISSSTFAEGQPKAVLANDVFLPRDNEPIHQLSNDKSHATNVSSLTSSTLTFTPVTLTPQTSSLLASAIIHQEITSEDSVGDYIATHFSLDNHKALLQQNQLNQKELSIEQERNPHSLHSSRSTSPMQIQISPRSTEDNESSRSSFSSNISSRNSLDLGFSTSTSARQNVQPDHNKRSDRPSTFLNTAVVKESSPNSPASNADINQTNSNVDLKHRNANNDRFLPKNERMRMDRPSQYS